MMLGCTKQECWSRMYEYSSQTAGQLCSAILLHDVALAAWLVEITSGEKSAKTYDIFFFT